MAPAVEAFAPAPLGPKTIRNRFIKAATFEGMAADSLVTDGLIDFHRAVAAGGVGMTTLAYLAVSRDGQGAPGEIVLRPEAVPGLARLVDAVHAHGAAAAAQIGHAGPVAAATRRPGLSASRVFTPMAMKFTTAVTDDDIARITVDFARAAGLLRDAGFDAVELHLGHNYLLSAFLSPALNRRTDCWGGSIANRAEFPRQVLRAVRHAVGPDMAVIAKLNMVDGYRGGLWLDDSIEAARLIESDGMVDAIELTGGSSLRNPHVPVPRRGADPRAGGRLPAAHAHRDQADRQAVDALLPVLRGVLPALRAAVPRGAGPAADPARRHQPTRDGAERAGRRLRLRRDGAGAAARTRPRPPLGRGRRRRLSATTATSACRPSTGGRTASWSRRRTAPVTESARLLHVCR